MKDNFVSLYNKFGRVLTYNEFVDNTNISLTTYCKKLNLSGQVYEILIGMYLSEEIKNEYLRDRKEFWKEIADRTVGFPGCVWHCGAHWTVYRVYDHGRYGIKSGAIV